MVELGIPFSPRHFSFSVITNPIFNIVSHEKFKTADFTFSSIELLLQMLKVFHFNTFLWKKKKANIYNLNVLKMERPVFEIIADIVLLLSSLAKIMNFFGRHCLK